MDDESRDALASMKMPRRAINYVPAKSGEIFKLGPMICRVMEDGSRTDNRIGSAEFTLPAGTTGPPAHWHEMHDETFLVTQGTVRFHAPDGKIVDAKVGDYVTVPVRAPHTFSNPFDEDAKFFITCTPAFYIDYFRIMAQKSKNEEKMSKEDNLQVMARFATMPANEMLEESAKGNA
ncbi:RmlC-like cupin [Sporormia fimetaria CBS 119925]|uniref:RmlC-like cupin n=1 Tax=Sporormia fimetaria CBS 119925 TaxID=1340428 RepID=A0A6A6VJM5_9PLEO|nr:RmlC-like cupin [Sporormia fimetaria CBS 119925]